MTEPKPLTRAESKYRELIGELPANTFLKEKSTRRLAGLAAGKEDTPKASSKPPEAIVATEGDDGDKPSSQALNWAANKVISVFAIARARRIAARRAKRVYQRYWEPHWGAEYYFNPLTKQSFWQRPEALREEDIPFADELSAAYAAEHKAAEAAAAADALIPKTWKERMAKMKEKNPKAGECDIVQPSRAEMLRSCMTLWGVEASLVQLRCLKLEGPFRQQYFWSGKTDDVMDFRIFVLDTELPGTTKFTLVTETKPDRGGFLTTFARTKPVSDYLEWPVGMEFYAYIAARPGTTLFNVFYSHSPFRSIVTTANSAGAVWTRHFSFHAYEGIDLYVREAPEGDRFCVALRNTMLDWPEVFKFVAFTKPAPGTIKLNVMQIFDPVHRFKVSPSSVATRSGWSLVFSVYVFDVPMPGTTKFAVQQRREPEECRVYRKMALKPWKDIFVFYAYDT